jgi:hypothetical protein
MAQRETLLPVCKVILQAGGTIHNIPLSNTAVKVDSVTITDPSGLYPAGKTDFTISAAGGASVSAIITVERTKTTTSTSSITATVKNAGVYNADNSALNVVDCAFEGQGPSSVYPDAGVGGVFTVNKSSVSATVPYISVTDLSGTNGYFRIAPVSATDYYISSTGAAVATGLYGAQATTASATSGTPGLIGGPGDTLVLTMQPGEMMAGILLENQLDASSYFALNYGVVKQANPLRDNDIPNAR